MDIQTGAPPVFSWVVALPVPHHRTQYPRELSLAVRNWSDRPGREQLHQRGCKVHSGLRLL